MPTESVLVRKDLMENAFNFGAFKTKEELLNNMLEDFVHYQTEMRKLSKELKGTVEYFDDSNLKGYKSK